MPQMGCKCKSKLRGRDGSGKHTSMARKSALGGARSSILLAALPPPDVTAAIVLFKPGTSAEAILTAVADVEDRILWADASCDLRAVDLDDPGRTRTFYRHGALLVSNTIFPSGCLNWFR